MTTVSVLLFPATLIAAALMTLAIRNIALARRMLDVPNERSSHERPTPRGGGLATVATFLMGLPMLASSGLLDRNAMLALLGAGAISAAAGFLDDYRHVGIGWRLILHFLAAIWALAWLGSLPISNLVGDMLASIGVGQVLAALYLVWMLNLYNFMDGIDGLAGAEATTVCLGGALIACVATPDMGGWAAPILLACAVTGFLVWNFPPARIFLGDVGSGFLGITLGVLSIDAARFAPTLFWGWIILLGVFIVDATTTLFRRLYRRQKFYLAHRSHAYQFASRKYGSHLPITLAVCGINLLWLTPLAVLVSVGWLDAVYGVTAAYAPLFLLAYRFNAGAPELQDC